MCLMQMRAKILIVVLFVVSLNCHAQPVYSAGVHSGGTDYFELSSTTLPFPPHEYKLTRVTWLEDTNGFTIMDINHKTAAGDVLRRSLEVVCGSEKFMVPLDSIPPQQVKSGYGLPVMTSSGDLAQLVTQYVTNRSGRVTTNALPVVQASWVRQSRPTQDIIVVDDDHFTEVKKFLEQAYGKPDAVISSAAPDLNGHSLTYIPAQVGVVLNLTGGLGMTIVSVIEKQKP